MRAVFITAAALAAILPAFGAPTTNVPISKFAGPVKTNSYIIKLKDGVSKDSHVSKLIAAFTAGGKVEYKYGEVFHGYAASLKGKDLDFIRQSSDIEYIVEDGIMTIDYEQGDETAAFVAREAPAIEGLEKRANGAGVDVYGIDTGIYTAHSSFGGRARWGATFGGYANQDGNGHGTHTAGTAVGASYGVATSANIIAVKVLSDSGSGTNSDVIAGINYAATQASNAVAGGLHFAIAAGNSNVDAGSTSLPALLWPTLSAQSTRATARRRSPTTARPRRWALGVNVSVPGSVEPLAPTPSLVPPWLLLVLLATSLSAWQQRWNSRCRLLCPQVRARAVVTGAPSGTTNLLAQPF
ncbi:peptidase S8/S53 domain-containing protein [Rhizoctonia solani]|nr:peptidase S8/S53 domain-containing protein [Rhizoctonia solani]